MSGDTKKKPCKVRMERKSRVTSVISEKRKGETFAGAGLQPAP